MSDKKQLEYAKDLRSDLRFCLESGEDKVVSKGEVETIKWLVEKAQQAEMYHDALKLIAEGKVETFEQSHLIAATVLVDAQFRFNDKIFPQERTVKNDG